MPGSKDRRVFFRDAVAFAKAHNMPIRELLLGFEGPQDDRVVWLVDDPGVVYPKILEQIIEATLLSIRVEYIDPGSINFELGLNPPSIIVLNYDLNRNHGIFNALVGNCLHAKTKLIVTASAMPQTARSLVEAAGGTVLDL